MRGATAVTPCNASSTDISIHAPLAGRDRRRSGRPPPASHFNPRAPCGARREIRKHSGIFCLYFNPRAPCGARPSSQGFKILNPLFQSTRPLRGATGNQNGRSGELRISIHAPLAGRDSKHAQKQLCTFVTADKIYRNSGAETPSAGAFQLFVTVKPRKIRCEPPGCALCASASHPGGPLSPCASAHLRSSAYPPEDRYPCSQNVRSCSRTSFQGSKTAGCPAPGP